jgi:hypothetical protein
MIARSSRSAEPRRNGMAIIYSDEVLEATPERTTKLLSGIGAVATIRTLLHEGGMNDDDIIEGRELLMACLAAPRGNAAPNDTADAEAQRAAAAALDEWDEPNFPRYQATLERHAPDVAAYVFFELAASTGAKATQGVATFLERLDALEHGTDPARAKSRKTDKKAIELLAKRGLTKEERARLVALVNVALGPTSVLPDGADAGQEARAARRDKLVELRQWYDEWATAARALVRKRGHLIRLGLAQRKVKAKPEPVAPPAAPPAQTQPQPAGPPVASAAGAGTAPA